MKTLKTIGLGLLASLALITSACNKKNDSNKLTYGSLSSDGSSITSQNSTIQGVALDLSIKNISATGNSYGATGYCAGYNTLGCSNGLNTTSTYDLTINGTSARVVSTTQWSQWRMIGNFYLSSYMVCADISCNTSYTEILLVPASGMFYEYKGIAFKKVNSQGAITSMREYQGSYDSVITQLNTMF